MAVVPGRLAPALAREQRPGAVVHSVLARIVLQTFEQILPCAILQQLSECGPVSALAILRRSSLIDGVKSPAARINILLGHAASAPSVEDYRAAVEALGKSKILNAQALVALDEVGSDRYRDGVAAIGAFMESSEHQVPQQRQASRIILDRLLSGPGSRARQDNRGIGKQSAQGKFAYVTVLWAPDDGTGDPLPAIVDAIVLGESLRQSRSRHDKVLLATPEITQHVAAAALNEFWQVREIVHVSTVVLTNTALSCDRRFSNVLTKLQALGQVDYQKVVLLDSDTMVTRNCDELFDVPAPAALMRGPRDHAPDSVRHARTYSKGGINGGVVVLEPDAVEFEAMCATLRGETDDAAFWRKFLKRCKGPEQDFLGEWYGTRRAQMRGLHPKYNYQLHQLLFHPEIENDRTQLRYNDIALFHFSTKHKPSAFLLSGSGSRAGQDNFDDWLKELFQIKGAEASVETHPAIYDIISRAMKDWRLMWKGAWRSLITQPQESLAGSSSCRLCGAQGPPNAHHFFFGCRQVLGLAPTWFSREQDPCASLVEPCHGTRAKVLLGFVASVRRRWFEDPPPWDAVVVDISGGTRPRESDRVAEDLRQRIRSVQEQLVQARRSTSLCGSDLVSAASNHSRPQSAESAGSRSTTQAELSPDVCGTSSPQLLHQAQAVAAGSLVASINARVGWQVDFVQFELRDGNVLRYGDEAGGEYVGPWSLDAHEAIVGVEQANPDAGRLGGNLTFKTSTGRSFSLKKKPSKRKKPASFEARDGSQICGLQFHASGRLIAVSTCRINQSSCGRPERFHPA